MDKIIVNLNVFYPETTQDISPHKMEEETITPSDLMKFLKGFKTTMEEKMEKDKLDMMEKYEKTNEKIDGHLDNIDGELEKLKDKVEGNEKINRRMDDRLTALELEMKKATLNKERSEKLRETLQEQTSRRKVDKIQPPRRTEQEEEQHPDPAQIEGDLRNTFRSRWARGMQEELNLAAGMKAKQVNNVKNVTNQPEGRVNYQDPWRDEQRQHEQPSGRSKDPNQQNENDNWITREPSTEWQDNREIPDRWEEILTKKKVLKVRKPVKIEEWFGFTSETESSDDTEDTTWTEIDRKKKKDEKKIRQKKKKKDLETQTAAKAANKVGLGPVNLELLEKYRTEKVPYEKAKIMAIKTLLSEQLEYDKDELSELTIRETKMTSNRENIIYTAFEDQSQVRELYIRKAELKYDRIVVRQYIPPNFYEKFSHLNMICRDKRMEDDTLKTQIRFGKRDLEIYVKHKGDETPFKLVKIEEFTDVESIPPFDHQEKIRNTATNQN